MTQPLLKGQELAGYTLLEPLGKTGDNLNAEEWLALDPGGQDRVCLLVFAQPLSPDIRQQLAGAIEQYRGLVHPAILRSRSLVRATTAGTAEVDFLVRPQRPHARPFQPGPDLRGQWPLLSQLLAALAYAHQLGAAHGHIYPGNLLVENSPQENGQQLYLRDFALPLPAGRDTQAFFSPQIRDGEAVDTTDDIYSVAALLSVGLTGRVWQPGEAFETSATVPEEVQQLLMRSLATSAYDRPQQIETLHTVLAAHYDPRSTPGDTLDSGQRPSSIQTSAFQQTTTDTRQAPEAPVAIQRLADEGAAVPLSTVIIGLLLLLTAAAAVFLYEPDPIVAATPQDSAPAVPVTASTPSAPVQRADERSPAELAPLELAKLEQLKKEARDIAEKLLRVQIELEDKGVQTWAADAYDTLVADGLAADEHFRQADYSTALRQYQATLAAAVALQGSLENVIKDNRARGEAALKNGDSVAAIDAYTVLLAIAPDDTNSRQQLQRAENLAEVQALVQQADEAEQQDNLEDARDLYQQALALDNQWAPATAGLQRVNQALTLRRFNNEMSRAFTNLAAGNLDTARAAFAAAQAILPASSAPADGLLQLALAEQAKSISHLRAQAEQAAASEDWAKALDVYNQVSAADATLLFARSGIDNATERLALDQKLVRYVNDSALLKDDAALADAKQALLQAARIKARGPRLQGQINTLSHLISLARIPLTLVLTSDTNTDVTVYQVGKLGYISRQELSLYPGNYTIVGKRAGYRDVRHELRLAGGDGPANLHISCTEKI